MQWFKHQSNAHSDAKLEKVMMKFGAEGYALYWYCIELIAGKVSASNVTFELEHDAELLGYKLKIDSMRVEEIMLYFISVGLFENSEGTITCMKLAKQLDERYTRSSELKEVIRQSSDSLQTVLRPLPLEQNRKNRTDRKEEKEQKEETRKKRPDKPPRSSADDRFDEWWSQYPKKVGKKTCLAIWKRRKLDTLADKLINDTMKRNAEDRKWKEGFIPNPTTYLNGDRWEDEIDNTEASTKSLSFEQQQELVREKIRRKVAEGAKQ